MLKAGTTLKTNINQNTFQIKFHNNYFNVSNKHGSASFKNIAQVISEIKLVLVYHTLCHYPDKNYLPQQLKSEVLTKFPGPDLGVYFPIGKQ